MATVIGGPANPVFVTNDDPDRSVGGGTALPVYVVNFADVPGGGGEPDASTTERGIIEIATTAEAQAGTDAERAVVPSGLPLRIIGTGLKGPSFVQGNPGTNAIDIQTNRTSANHIASGANAVAIGAQNRATGADAVSIGRSNTVSQANGIAIGLSCTAAQNAISIGNNALGVYSGGITLGAGTVSWGINGIAIGINSQAPANGIALGPNIDNTGNDNTVMIGVSATDYLRLTTFTPAVGAGVASTHTLSVNISGTVYRVLLANP